MTDREIKPEEIGEEIPEEIEQFLAEVGASGYQVSIRRLQPEWCKGYLDTWSLDEPFKLRTLRDVYGGKKFMCRILNPHGGYLRSFTIDIDDEPKREGIILKRFPADVPPVQYLANKTDNATPSPDLKILEMLEATRKDQINFLMSLLLKDRRDGDPLQQMQNAAKMTQALRDMASSFGEGGEEGGNTGLILKTILGMMEQRKNAPAPQPPRPPQVIYKPMPRPAPVPKPATPRPAPVPNPAPTAAPPEPPDVIDQLLDLEPQSAGLAIKEFVESLPEDEAKEVIATALSMPADLVDFAALSGNMGNGSGLGVSASETNPTSATGATVHNSRDDDPAEDDPGTITEDDPPNRTGNSQG